ncbi:MAG TPA: hypothetical protein VGD02_13070 [Gemmatimonadaceae bacterium]|jgi:hypothetical protein
MRSLLAAAFALLLIGGVATAQGSLSAGGLGYPPGQMSARAEGAGGALADFDPMSLVAPAALAGVGVASVFLQYSPEFRRVTAGSNTAKTTTARFPLVSGVLPMGQQWTFGLSSSTFLDRSYETSLDRRANIGSPADTFDLTERTRVLGAINDVRMAFAWARSPLFRLGFGGHVFVGSNRVTFSQLFPDSTFFLSSSQTSRVSYAGFAGSVGAEFHPSRVIGFSVSGRVGGDLRAEVADTLIGKAKIPTHYSASVMYEGLTGVTLSARVAHDAWSSLADISPGRVSAFDGWDESFGAEASGPRFLQRTITVRGGARFRTLPFGFNGNKVSEKSVMLGLGAPLARDRASFDFALQRAMRTSADINERGFVLSFGLRVSP